MDIQNLKDEAFKEAIKELREEYSHNLEVLKKIEQLEKKK